MLSEREGGWHCVLGGRRGHGERRRSAREAHLGLVDHVDGALASRARHRAREGGAREKLGHVDVDAVDRVAQVRAILAEAHVEVQIELLVADRPIPKVLVVIGGASGGVVAEARDGRLRAARVASHELHRRRALRGRVACERLELRPVVGRARGEILSARGRRRRVGILLPGGDRGVGLRARAHARRRRHLPLVLGLRVGLARLVCTHRLGVHSVRQRRVAHEQLLAHAARVGVAHVLRLVDEQHDRIDDVRGRRVRHQVARAQEASHDEGRRHPEHEHGEARDGRAREHQLLTVEHALTELDLRVDRVASARADRRERGAGVALCGCRLAAPAAGTVAASAVEDRGLLARRLRAAARAVVDRIEVAAGGIARRRCRRWRRLGPWWRPPEGWLHHLHVVIKALGGRLAVSELPRRHRGRAGARRGGLAAGGPTGHVK